MTQNIFDEVYRLKTLLNKIGVFHKKKRIYIDL
jgi:hypothetical protein